MISYPSSKTWEVLYEGMFHVVLNANDFFGYACADAVELCNVDFKWAFPIIDKYGYDGLHAVMAYVENCTPIQEVQTEGYLNATKELEELMPLVYSKISEWPKELLELARDDRSIKIPRSRQCKEGREK